MKKYWYLLTYMEYSNKKTIKFKKWYFGVNNKYICKKDIENFTNNVGSGDITLINSMYLGHMTTEEFLNEDNDTLVII